MSPTHESVRHLDKDDEPRAMHLSLIEQKIIAAILGGATDKDISARLGVSDEALNDHLSHIFREAGVANRLELALYAVHHQLIPGADTAAAEASDRAADPAGRSS